MMDMNEAIDRITAAAVKVAVAKEREECAKLCEDMALYTGVDCANKIRERSNARTPN